jgi:aquaporin Z
MALIRHHVEYVIEAMALAVFMIAAMGFTVLLEHPALPLRGAIDEPALRRFLMGLAMGATFVTIAYSPWGARSGAHLNPAVTLTFLRLGKITRLDAVGYVAAQFAGGLVGTAAGARVFGALASAPEVRYVVTVPGAGGAALAFLGEAAISFVMMTVVLHASSRRRLAHWTALLAGLLVAIWITVEAPLSGMSMNPARTLGPAIVAAVPTALWVYFTAPTLGMLAAAEMFVRSRGIGSILCAKLYHGTGVPCPFKCHFTEMPS